MRKAQLKVKGKTFTKPRTKIKISDESCNRRLKEYSEKLKNMDWVLYAPHLPKPLKMFYRTYTTDSVKKGNDLWLYDPKKETKPFDEFKLEIDSLYPETYYSNGSDIIFYKYEPIPENVACKALEILDKPENWWSKIKVRASEQVDDYSIYFLERDDMPYYWGKGLSLVISKGDFLNAEHPEFSETSEVNLGHVLMFGVHPIEKEWTNFDSIDISWK